MFSYWVYKIHYLSFIENETYQKTFEILLPLLIFFFLLTRVLFFWFHVRNINIAFEIWHFFCAGKFNMAFMKNWRMTEKSCPFHFASYNKQKLRGLTETFLSTALSTNYLNYFVIVPIDWWDACLFILSPRFVSFCSCFCDFFNGFFFFFFKHPIFTFLLLRKHFIIGKSLFFRSGLHYA